MTTETKEVTKLWVADTNIFLSNLERLTEENNIVLMSTVRQELDNHKTSKYEDLSYKARKANRFIFENYTKFTHDVGEYDPEKILGNEFSKEIKDNRIIACAASNGYGVITNDLNLYTTAKAFELEVKTFNENIQANDTYKGFLEIYMTPDEHQDFYTNKLAENICELNVNQYLIIKDDITDKEIDTLKWNGEHHVAIKPKTLKSQRLGSFKSYDAYQTCAIDSVLSNQFTMLRGAAGTAKTAIALSYAMQELQSGNKYSKIIIFSNAVPTHNAFYHGLVRGDLQTKLLDSSIGNILASKLGSRSAVEAMLLTEELMVLPASDIRGFDSSGMNAIIIVTEGQNWSRELMKLAIQRLGQDCKLIIEGDNFTQLDNKEFQGSNNGMSAASEIFRGQSYYGEVELQNIYRSEIAKRAELMTLRK